MSYFSDLMGNIEDGLNGKNRGVSLGMPRLDNYISLRKKMFYMVMGSSGSGKSSLVYDSFILNPVESKSRKMHYILFMMERSRTYIHAKWLSRRIFLDHGIIIPIARILNWIGQCIDDKERELITTYEDYFDFLQEHVDIYEGSRSASDIFRIVMNYAEAHGKIEQISEYKKQYVARDEEEMVVVVVDHFGLTKTTKEYPTKKQSIDRLSEHIQHFRDFLGYSIVAVNQLNRDLSSPIYTKMDSFEPHLDNAKETGTTVEAADVVLSVFDPIRYKTNDAVYGDVSTFKCPNTGHKYFRNLKVLKNSYGIDDAPIGTVFQGETGIFRELPKSSYIKENWKEEDYKQIFNNSYFLK